MTNINAFVQIGKYVTPIVDKYWIHPASCENDPYNFSDDPPSQTHSQHDMYGSCGCNSFENAIQCHGFAKFLAKLVFNSFPAVSTDMGTVASDNGRKFGDWTMYTNGNYGSITLEPGDIIRTGTPQNGHTAMVQGVGSDGVVKVAECWGTYNSQIAFGKFNGTNYTETDLKNMARYIVKAPKTTSSATAVTVNYDANGGTCATASASTFAGFPYMSMPTPTRSGYTFIGWWPEKNSNSEEFAREIIVPNYEHTLYAHWAKKYRIMCVGHMKCLTYDDTPGEIGNGNAVKLGTSLSAIDKHYWLIPRLGTKTVIKAYNSWEFGLSNKNGSCITRRTFKNESTSIVDIVAYGNYYKIKLRGQELYLTATAAASNAPVKWLAKDDSNSLQLWTFEES